MLLSTRKSSVRIFDYEGLSSSLLSSPAIPSREVIPSRFYALGEACTVFDDRDRAIVARFRRSKKNKLRGQVHIDGF